MEQLSAKPPLKWAGGKRWLVPILQEFWKPHKHRRLVEPFVGGMAIALGLLPENALLNDKNVHLINFYQWLRQGLTVQVRFENDETHYYENRSRFNELITSGKTDSKEAAELFYYLNRTGFNGLCRFNKRGTFNVPFGRYKTINYALNFTEYKDIFSPWIITHGDFSEVLIQPNDFIYADPPYDVEFTSYSSGGFEWEEQERLALWLNSQNVPVVVSNQATSRILDLYDNLGFDMRVVDAPRRISCNGDRTPAKEMIAHKGL